MITWGCFNAFVVPAAIAQTSASSCVERRRSPLFNPLILVLLSSNTHQSTSPSSLFLFLDKDRIMLCELCIQFHFLQITFFSKQGFIDVIAWMASSWIHIRDDDDVHGSRFVYIDLLPGSDDFALKEDPFYRLSSGSIQIIVTIIYKRNTHMNTVWN